MCVSYLTDDGRILIMTSVTPVSFRSVAANYNAVKIKVDEPKTTVPEGFKFNL